MARHQYKAALRQAILEYNAKFIDTSTNKCKTAWGVINQSRGSFISSAQPLNYPEDFNNFCIISEEAMRQSVVPSAEISAAYLLNHHIPATQLVWREVSCDEVFRYAMSMKNGKSKDAYGISSELLHKVLPAVVALSPSVSMNV